MNGTRSFRVFMQRLAVVAVLLMLLAPLISRWQQSHSLLMDDPVLCQSEEHIRHHSDSSSKHHGNKDHHENHSIACDYCVLLTRLLPLLVWLCLLPTALSAGTPNLHLAFAAAQAAYWPVPHPRGPPLYC